MENYTSAAVSEVNTRVTPLTRESYLWMSYLEILPVTLRYYRAAALGYLAQEFSKVTGTAIVDNRTTDAEGNVQYTSAGGDARLKFGSEWQNVLGRGGKLGLFGIAGESKLKDYTAKKVKGGIELSIPVASAVDSGSDNENIFSIYTLQNLLGTYVNGSYQVIPFVDSLFGDEAYTLDKGVTKEIRFNGASVIKSTPYIDLAKVREVFDYQAEAFSGNTMDEDDEFLNGEAAIDIILDNFEDMFTSSFMGIKIFIPPSLTSQTSVSSLSVQVLDKQEIGYKTRTATPTSLAQFDEIAPNIVDNYNTGIEQFRKNFKKAVLDSKKPRIHAIVFIPDVVAAYMTQTPVGKTPIGAFGSFITNKMQQEFLNVAAVNKPDSKRDTRKAADLQWICFQMENVRAAVDKSDAAGLVRTNTNNYLAIDLDGAPYYIPESWDGIDEYSSTLSASQTQDGTWALNDPLTTPAHLNIVGHDREYNPHPKLPGVSNRLVYVDWKNSVVTYVENNELQLQELQHFQAMTTTMILRYLQGGEVIKSHVSHVVERILDASGRKAKVAEYELAAPSLADGFWLVYCACISANPSASSHDIMFRPYSFTFTSASAETAIQLYNSKKPTLEELFGLVGDSYGAHAIYRLFSRVSDKITSDARDADGSTLKTLETMFADRDITPSSTDDEYYILKFFTENSVKPKEYAIYRVFREIYESLGGTDSSVALPKANDYLNGRAVLTALQELAIIVLVAKYGRTGQTEKVKENYTKLAESLKKEGVPEEWNPAPVANIGEGKILMPHQGKVDYYVDKSLSPSEILSVRAGGGKTISLMVTSVMRRMMKRQVKRPLIICPQRLFKNYLKDSNAIFDGKMNVIAIDNTNVRKYNPLGARGGAQSLGYEGIKKMIKSSPRNTIVVVDPFFISRAQSETLGYGPSAITKNLAVEMLLDCGFDLVAMDESHFARNFNNSTLMIQCLFSAAKYRILATGTFIFKGPSDIPNQMRLVDPTVFGSDSNFIENYASDSRGNPMEMLSDDMKAKINLNLVQNTNFIQVERKEWASLLPTRDDAWWTVNWPEPKDGLNLAEIYEGILKEAMEEIEASLNSAKKSKADTEDSSGDEDGDEYDDPSEGALLIELKRHISSLESFTMSPATHPVVAEFAARGIEIPVGPKVKLIANLCRRHFDGMTLEQLQSDDPTMPVQEITKEIQDAGGIPASSGKILICANYYDSCKAIYDGLPDDLKKITVLFSDKRYSSSSAKAKFINEFELDANKKILIGITDSIREGHNFQFATRLILAESPWTSGAVEQLESRINRPIPTSTAARPTVHFDTIIMNGSIDVTKQARYISRVINNALIEEQDNPRYKAINEVELLSLSLENIKNMRWCLRGNERPPSYVPDSGHRQNLVPYIQELVKINRLRKQEITDYLNDTSNRSAMYNLVPAPDLEGSATIVGAPIIPGSTIANMDKLGLINYATWASTEEPNNPQALYEADPTDIRVYTAMGFGIVKRHKDSTLAVILDDGRAATFNKLSCFVSTNSNITTADVVGSTGLPVVAVTDFAPVLKKGKSKKAEVIPETPRAPKTLAPVPEPVPQVKKPKKVVEPEPEPEEEDEVIPTEIDVNVWNYNGMQLCLNIDGEYLAEEEIAELRSNGWIRVPDFVSTQIKTAKQYSTLLEILTTKFDIGRFSLQKLEHYHELFVEGKTRNFSYEIATRTQFVDWYRRSHKRLDKGQIMPICTVENGKFYISFDIASTPSIAAIKKIIVPGIKWNTWTDMLVFLSSSKQDAVSELRRIKTSYVIANEVELKAELKSLKLVKSQV